MMHKEFKGEAGAGLVIVVLDSKGFPLRIEIDDMIFKKTDKKLISDLFIAALNNAFNKVDNELKKQLQKSLMYNHNIEKNIPLLNLIPNKDDKNSN